jgi:hypothetical protein
MQRILYDMVYFDCHRVSFIILVNEMGKADSFIPGYYVCL